MRAPRELPFDEELEEDGAQLLVAVMRQWWRRTEAMDGGLRARVSAIVAFQREQKERGK